MITWTDLKQRLEIDGLTAALTHDARTAISSPPELQAYIGWQRKLAPDQYRAEQKARVEVLAAIQEHLNEGHIDHSRTTRHYIESRDVVVTGATNDDGVPVQCSDPVCHAWHMYIYIDEVKK